MKYISFVIPCYNSSEYMNRCIDSLLVIKDNIEVIIIDDGSTDDTYKIALEYQDKYPKIVKAVHKENGGHGSGVNTGLKIATGKYFKVVDSDDWLDKDSLIILVDTIKKQKRVSPDLIVCNYIYDHLYENKKKVMKFNNVFKKNKIISWDEIKPFKISQYLIMHSLIYKTNILKASKLKLPEHTFYVDNIVAYQPLPFVKSILYLDLDLYHYFIGRSDQSVNESVMVSRVMQQVKVTKFMVDALDLNYVKDYSKKLYNYLLKMLSMMVTISDIYLLMKQDDDSLKVREDLWNYIKEVDIDVYKILKRKKLAGLTYNKTKVGDKIVLDGYKIAKKIYKFN